MTGRLLLRPPRLRFVELHFELQFLVGGALALEGGGEEGQRLARPRRRLEEAHRAEADRVRRRAHLLVDSESSQAERQTGGKRLLLKEATTKVWRFFSRGGVTVVCGIVRLCA